jgi:hypothetical protein
MWEDGPWGNNMWILIAQDTSVSKCIDEHSGPKKGNLWFNCVTVTFSMKILEHVV